MTLENKIQELQRKLAVKQAYLDATFKFPHSKTIPADVIQEVTTKLTEICAQLAEGMELEQDVTPNSFNADEVRILKQIADKILTKSTEAPKVASPTKPNSKAVFAEVPAEAPSKGLAQIIMLSNIDATLRNKIAPQSMVRIIGGNDVGDAFVETEEGRHRFWIPKDDLEIL